jgi:ABC-type transport system involved in multi-copper enzyme maturation permease subunit
MIGTIVHQELLLGSRRNRLRLFRVLYALWLFVQVFYYYAHFLGYEQQKYFIRMQATWMNRGAMPEPFVPDSAPQMVGAWFTETFITQQFIFLAIATPALVAGAITDEKRRGTLQYLMLTDLGTRPLLLGKLLGRVAQVGMLTLVGLPVFALLGGFGGLEPLRFLAVGAMAALTTLAAAAAALLASVWCRQTRDAILALYAVGVAGGLAVWKFGGVLSGFDPLWVLAPADPGESGELVRRLGLAALDWGVVGLGCLGLAVWRLKPAYLRQLEGSPAKKVAWYAGRRTAVDEEEPVRWRERHVEGLAPAVGLRRVPQWLALTLVALTTTLTSVLILWLSLAPGATPAEVAAAWRELDFIRIDSLLPGAASGFLIQSVTILLVATLVVGIRCSGSITGERERQTWEPLLLSAISARELIHGKLWGVMGASYAYLLACGLPALILSAVAGPLAVFWTVVWLAVTVLAMYYVGAAGLWSSVKSKSSWQALLYTLFWGYLVGALINAAMSALLFVILMLIITVLLQIDVRLKTALTRSFLNNFNSAVNVLFVAICISLAILSWVSARIFLNWSLHHIAKRERTRQWPSAPVYRKAKRRSVRRAVPRT